MLKLAPLLVINCFLPPFFASWNEISWLDSLICKLCFANQKSSLLRTYRSVSNYLELRRPPSVLWFRLMMLIRFPLHPIQNLKLIEFIYFRSVAVFWIRVTFRLWWFILHPDPSYTFLNSTLSLLFAHVILEPVFTHLFIWSIFFAHLFDHLFSLWEDLVGPSWPSCAG